MLARLCPCRYLGVDHCCDIVSVYTEDSDGGSSQLAFSFVGFWYDTDSFYDLPVSSRVRVEFTTDPFLDYYGFVLEYTVKQQGAVQPAPAYGGQGTFPGTGTGSPLPGGSSPLCDEYFNAYSADIPGENVVSISSDHRWWLTQSGVAAGEGQATETEPPVSPWYPLEDPGEWLQPYEPLQTCLWRFELPQDTVATVLVKWVSYVCSCLPKPQHVIVFACNCGNWLW